VQRSIATEKSNCLPSSAAAANEFLYTHKILVCSMALLDRCLGM